MWNFTDGYCYDAKLLCIQCIVAKANLIDVELGQSGVEHKIEIIKHRHDLHRRAFAGQCCERHNVGEIDGRLREQLWLDVCARL